jgi:hypothetical protein
MKNISTQDFLEIDYIKEGIIVLKNKGLRAILMVSSQNFDLKAEGEQQATIYQFQNFLNSLDFPCQILIQSRRLNFVGYLDKLEEIEKKEKNELFKTQIVEYRKFVAKIIEEGTIMQKNFYVVVPFSTGEARGPGAQGIASSVKNSKINPEEFKRAKNQLFQRVEFVSLGLRSCGLTSVPLQTVEITELLWGLYHPQEAERGYYPEIPPELSI